MAKRLVFEQYINVKADFEEGASVGCIDREEEIGTKQRWEERQSCTQVGHCEGQDKPVGIGLQARSSDDKINYDTIANHR